MQATVKILYPAAAATVVEPSGRHTFDPTVHPTPWIEVGVETIDVDTPEAAANIVYDRWNNGSGRESDRFRAAHRRSFSVGDMIVIPEMETTYRCARFGWNRVAAPLADQITATGEDTMDFDYGWANR